MQPKVRAGVNVKYLRWRRLAVVFEKVFRGSLKSNKLVQTHVMPILNELTDMHPRGPISYRNCLIKSRTDWKTNLSLVTDAAETSARHQT
jgi:hypothetical protein